MEKEFSLYYTQSSPLISADKNGEIWAIVKFVWQFCWIVVVVCFFSLSTHQFRWCQLNICFGYAGKFEQVFQSHFGKSKLNEQHHVIVSFSKLCTFAPQTDISKNAASHSFSFSTLIYCAHQRNDDVMVMAVWMQTCIRHTWNCTIITATENALNREQSLYWCLKKNSIYEAHTTNNYHFQLIHSRLLLFPMCTHTHSKENT